MLKYPILMRSSRVNGNRIIETYKLFSSLLQLPTYRLSQKRAIQGPKNRRPARNPLKTLAARDDLKSEYTEIRTGVADRELKRLKLESSKTTHIQSISVRSF